LNCGKVGLAATHYARQSLGSNRVSKNCHCAKLKSRGNNELWWKILMFPAHGTHSYVGMVAFEWHDFFRIKPTHKSIVQIAFLHNYLLFANDNMRKMKNTKEIASL
jgi:hypothetical protein